MNKWGLTIYLKNGVCGTVDVVEMPMIDIYGEGCSTGKLLEVTDRIVKDAKVIYQNVWGVWSICMTAMQPRSGMQKRRMALFDAEIGKPSRYNPGTTVYQLVEELRKYLDE